jgi:hypothetical protein
MSLLPEIKKPQPRLERQQECTGDSKHRFGCFRHSKQSDDDVKETLCVKQKYVPSAGTWSHWPKSQGR